MTWNPNHSKYIQVSADEILSIKSTILVKLKISYHFIDYYVGT